MTGSTFDEFVSVHSTSPLGTAYLLVGDRGHAEDLVQTTLVRVASHWRVAQEASRPYAHRVLIEVSRNHIRDGARRPRVASRRATADSIDSPPANRSVDQPVPVRMTHAWPDQERLIHAHLDVVEGCSHGQERVPHR